MSIYPFLLFVLVDYNHRVDQVLRRHLFIRQKKQWYDVNDQQSEYSPDRPLIPGRPGSPFAPGLPDNPPS